MSRRDGGFTLVELIVVTVLGALLIGATLQILITNQRTYTAQNVQIAGQQATRAALDLLTVELREVSPAGGDLVAMDEDSIRVRAARKIGLVCSDTTLGVTTFRVRRLGDWIGVGDSVFVFADNSGTSARDDNWITASVTAADTTSACGLNPAQLLTFSNGAAFAADSVSSGGLVRSFEHFAYGIMEDGGVHYLGRRGTAESWTPLVGPVREEGILFRYLDSVGAETSVDTLVSQIEVTVLSGSTEVMGPTGEPISDSVTVRVFTRN